ncbi:MAG: MarR family transcriptional regulator [Parvibaculaceae bacterium]|nr:MarR family transcriptional regulator [Parvibaculaceae bacterium]
MAIEDAGAEVAVSAELTGKTARHPDERLAPQYFVQLITQLGDLLSTIYDRRTNLSRNQTRIIMTLYEADGQTQTELANQLHMHKVSIGIHLTELEALGLIERRSHPTDGRAKCIYLTPLVYERAESGRQRYAEIHERGAEGIPTGLYLAMIEAIGRMRDNLIALDEEDRKKNRP